MQSVFHALSEYIRAEHMPVYTVSMAEADGNPVTACITPANPCQNAYSVAKAFTTTAIGILHDEGSLHTDDKICSLLPAYFDAWKDEIDPRWYSITVHMALTHHMGLPGGFLDIDCQDAVSFGKDYLHYVLTAPLLCDPKEKSTYTDAAFYVLGRIVSEKTEKNLTEFLWDRVFFPLGFREAAFSTCPMGYAMGATGLYIRTEDMVKLGQTYICNGEYRGTHIVSREWLSLCRAESYELHPLGNGWYGKGGMRGQMLCMHFDKKYAIAWHGYHADNEKILNWIQNEV